MRTLTGSVPGMKTEQDIPSAHTPPPVPTLQSVHA